MPPDLHLPPPGWLDPRDPGIRLRALEPAHDVPLLHRWFTRPQAVFWGMQQHTLQQTHDFYATLVASGHAHAYVGLVDGARAFLVECYDPARDLLAAHYAVRDGDLGMHFFVGPAQRPVHGYTRRVFRSLMRFMFEHLDAQRIVVEPDVRNDKVQRLNAEMGFVHQCSVALPHKHAALAFCTRDAFHTATERTTFA